LFSDAKAGQQEAGRLQRQDIGGYFLCAKNVRNPEGLGLARAQWLTAIFAMIW